MEKLYCKLCKILTTVAIAIAHGQPQVTNLVLYMHETLSGLSPTNVAVAFANSTAISPTLFPLVAVIDNPIRIGISPTSMLVAQGQGIIALDSKERFSIHMTIDIVFTSGAYSGNSLNVMGQNPYLLPYREVSIVGGTGHFQLARGIIGVTTMSMNSFTGDVVFKYNMTIYRY